MNQGHNIEIPSITRHVLLSDGSNSIMLTKISPRKIAQAIDSIIQGKVELVTPLLNEKLLIKTSNFQQVQQLLKLNKLPDCDIPIWAEVAWDRETINGKIKAHCFLDEERLTIINRLKDQKVMNITKMFTDPSRENEPVFIVTFTGHTLPEYLYYDYFRYPIEPYYMPPLLCYHCQKFGHSSTICKGTTSIYGKCGHFTLHS